MIRKVFSLKIPFHLLIVEDNSPDGTATIVKKLQTEFPEQLHMLERKGKLGLGTAYIAGFKWALEHGYDYIFEMDCDFSHNPDDLERLYKSVADGADVAIGSRYIDNSDDPNANADDKALLVVYNPVKNQAVTSKMVTRADLTGEIQVPVSFSGDVFHAWVIFQSADEQLVSESTYV